MTPFEISRFPFTPSSVSSWAPLNVRNANWPIVYVLDGDKSSGITRAVDRLKDVYVGESLNAAARMKQHFGSPEKSALSTVRVIVDPTFNKSVCLDLESYLIRMLAGDGSYRVLNRNDGITESDYYNRDKYRKSFSQVFDELKKDGVFTRTIPEIENSDLFKLSPFRALTQDQAVAVEDILEGLFADLESGASSTVVIRGEPGTGKTVVAIYLLKLLVDIGSAIPVEDLDSDSLFSEFYVEGFRSLAANLEVGLVVPQQSLRESIRRVFRRTPGLRPDMVMTPFDVGLADREFDLLIVDETHRLNQRANQASAAQNTKFRTITEKLFGSDDVTKTQLDWIRAKSKHQVLLLDAAQSVRPADLPSSVLSELVTVAAGRHRNYRLATQMRVSAGNDYVGFIRRVLGTTMNGEDIVPVARFDFGDYDIQMFDNLEAMRNEIRMRDREYGLARMVAGFAWPWSSKTDKTRFDIEIDGLQLRWNGTQVDWIASPNSLDEVGSIHTVQGYDLNYAGVIVGPDLRYDAVARRLRADRDSYFDKKGKENNPVLGRSYSDEDLLKFITNIYSVLMTRGIRGTYIHVCDPDLREYLGHFFAVRKSSRST